MVTAVLGPVALGTICRSEGCLKEHSRQPLGTEASVWYPGDTQPPPAQLETGKLAPSG